MTPRLEGVAWACLAVLLSSAFYETLVALEIVSLGSAPGDGAFGSGVVLAAAMLASLVAAVVSVTHAVEARCDVRLVWAALAPAGALYLVARWYTFDPYYLPSLRRYADGEIHGPWIAVVVLAAVGAALLSLRLPRAGSIWSSVVLLIAAATAVFLPIGK